MKEHKMKFKIRINLIRILYRNQFQAMNKLSMTKILGTRLQSATNAINVHNALND